MANPVSHGHSLGEHNGGFGPGMDFALGDVRGLRLWKPEWAPSEKGEPDQERVVLKSIFRHFFWGEGVMDADCSNMMGPLSKDGGRQLHIRLADCIKNHHHDYTTNRFVPGTPGCSRPHHDGIDPLHTCGFYAYTATADNPYLESNHGLHVEGVIQGFGRTIIGTKGFRCGKARILALVLPHHIHGGDRDKLNPRERDLSDATDELLRQTYPNTPVFPTREAMLREFPLTHPEDLT